MFYVDFQSSFFVQDCSTMFYTIINANLFRLCIARKFQSIISSLCSKICPYLICRIKRHKMSLSSTLNLNQLLEMVCDVIRLCLLVLMITHSMHSKWHMLNWARSWIFPTYSSLYIKHYPSKLSVHIYELWSGTKHRSVKLHHSCYDWDLGHRFFLSLNRHVSSEVSWYT